MENNRFKIASNFKMAEETSKLVKPKYIELLSQADVVRYNSLRQTLSSNLCRYNRGNRLSTFQEMLTAIKTFCIHNDEDDWKRCLVCGICWLPQGIAVNNRQFSLLIDKCKSSINGSFQRMGYGTIQSRQDSQKLLTSAIPYLNGKYTEVREWSVRQFAAVTPQPHLPLLPNRIIAPKLSPVPSLPNGMNAMSPVGNKWDQNPFGSFVQQQDEEQPHQQTADQVNQDDPNYQNNPFEDDDPFSLEPAFLYE